MKKQNILIFLSLLCSTAMTAQNTSDENDTLSVLVNLNEITITGAPSSSRMILSSLPVSAITMSELGNTASGNIINAITVQPGVSEITTGSGISKPVIRGLGYNRLAVVNDGIRQEGNQWGDEHGIEIDENSIDSVEIIKGPMSLMYGSDAMAGVVIMHDVPRSYDGNVGGIFSSQYQSNNGLIGSSLRLGYGKNDMYINGQLSGKVAHSYTNKNDGYVPGTGFSEYAGKVKTGIKRKWGHSNLTASFYNLKPEIAKGERDTITGDLETDSDNLKSYVIDLPFQKVNHYKLMAENAVYRPLGMIQTSLGYQLNSRMEFEESKNECELHFLLHTLNYDAHFISKKKNDWQYMYGINGMAQNSLNQGEEVLIPEYRMIDAGMFAMASKSMERWSFNGGFRYDVRHITSDELQEEGVLHFAEFTRFFNSVSGSMGTVYTCGENCSLRLNVARGFRAPNISELASNGVHEGTIRYEVGDNSLNPEYSAQADFGIDVTSRFVTAQAELFANRINNYIFSARSATVIDPEYTTYKYKQGDAFLAGCEARADVRPTRWLSAGVQLSYVRGTLLTTDTNLPMIPPMEFDGFVTAKATQQWKMFRNASLSCSVKHFCKQNHFYDVDDTETETPQYTLLGLSASTDIATDKRTIAEIRVIADNLFDVAYQSHLSRLKYADINVVTGEQGVYNMGRNVTLKVIVPIGRE